LVFFVFFLFFLGFFWVFLGLLPPILNIYGP
jgi:hypothetical protein